MRKLLFINVNFETSFADDLTFEINRLKALGYEIYGFHKVSDQLSAELLAKNTQLLQNLGVSVDTVTAFSDSVKSIPDIFITPITFDSIYYAVSAKRPESNWDEAEGYILDKVIYDKWAPTTFTLQVAASKDAAQLTASPVRKSSSPYLGEDRAGRNNYTANDGTNTMSVLLEDNGYRSSKLASALSTVNTNLLQRFLNGVLKLFSNVKNLFAKSSQQVSPISADSTSATNSALSQIRSSSQQSTAVSPSAATANNPVNFTAQRNPNRTFSIFVARYSLDEKTPDNKKVELSNRSLK
jgi:hypothetical protein